MEIRYGGVYLLTTNINNFGCPQYFEEIKTITNEKWVHFLCSFPKRPRNSKMKAGQFLFFIMSHMFRFGLLCSYSIAKRASDVMTQTRLRQTNRNGG